MTEQEKNWGVLMAKAQDGDSAAYDRLLSEILPVVRSYCFKRVGYLGLGEDATQEAIMTIHKARNTYDPAQPFVYWMFGIVRYKMIDVIRRWKTHATKETFDEIAMEKASGDESSGGAFQAGGEQVEMFRELLKEMDETGRQVLEMTKVQGLSIREVSQKLNISEGAVKVRVHRAVKELTEKVRARIYE